MAGEVSKLKAPFRRKRSKGEIVPGVRHYTETTFSGTVNATDTDNNAMSVGEVTTTTDVVTPGYAKRIARGDVINNPFYSRIEKRGHSYAGYHVRRNSGSGSTVRDYESDGWYTTPVGFATTPRPWTSLYNDVIRSLKNEAGARAMSQLNAADIDGLVEIAEAHKVRDAFRLRLRNFSKYLDKALRVSTPVKLALMTAKEINELVTSNWLRYRYGIMPNLYLLEDLLVGEKVWLKRATARGFTNYHSAGSYEVAKSGTFYSDIHTIDEVYDVTVRAGILYRPDPINRFGFSWRRLLPAAWELIPFSFVADWFVNFGSVISAKSMAIGVKQLAVWTAYYETYERTSTLESTWKSPSGYSNLQTPTGGHFCRVDSTTRLTQISANLALRRTSISDIPHDKRLLDSWSLVSQQFNRLMRETKPRTSVRRGRPISISPRNIPWSR